MPRTDTAREPLTRDAIIAAAVDFADRHGIEALSMRKLGQQLGVEAMSLYNHVAGKDEILDRMADYLFGAIEVRPSDDWKEAVRYVATSAKDVFVAHPWSVQLLATRDILGENAFALMDTMMGMLRGAGYDPETTHHAWHVIASHVLGYAFQETNSPFGGGEDHDHEQAEDLIRRFAVRFPNLTEVAPHLMQCSHPEEFAFGLEIILSGIEARKPE